MTRTRARLIGLLLGIACALPVPATAQNAALERQRSTVFAQMLAAPSDRALLLEYARLSVRLRDFEAAASTLERFLDFDPDNAEARAELATAYFALGAYDVAEYHLAAAAASGGLTAEQLERVARYRDETDARQSPHQITGRVALGQSWARESDQRGTFGTAQLDWRFDMGGPNAHEWLTQLAFSRYAPGEVAFSDRQVTRLRTGPEFRLTGDGFGPRLQPYVELLWFREDLNLGGATDYNSVAFGIAYQNPHNAFWTSHADLQFGEADLRDPFEDDFEFRDMSIGVTYRPSRETRIRGTIGWRHEDEINTAFPQYETTRNLRLEALHVFDTGWQNLPRRWEARGWLTREMVEQGDTTAVLTEYTDTGFGVGLRAFLTDEFFVEARGARLDRDYDDAFTASERETVYSLQIGWEF